MKIGLILLLPAVGLGQAWAQETTPPVEKGNVLLLPSERGLEGDIERVGDQYRIRRGTGETLVPARQALKLCKDWTEALDYMKSRANLADADERLRLVRWCHLHNLREAALVEAKAALEIRPKDPQAKHWVEALGRVTLQAPGTRVVQTGGVAPTASKPPPALDLNADTVAAFTTRIQPMLMNVCANCHVAGRGGAFQLTRSFEGGTKQAAQRNLAAVLAQVNVENPAISPLLVKAVSAHDGVSSSPPLASRNTLPFRALQGWVEQTVASNPHLKPNPSTTVAQNSPPPRGLPAVIAVAPGLPLVAPAAGPKNPIVSKTIDRIQDSALNNKTGAPSSGPPNLLPANLQQAQTLPPSVSPSADDPFDPAEFNRQNHPPR